MKITKAYTKILNKSCLELVIMIDQMQHSIKADTCDKIGITPIINNLLAEYHNLTTIINNLEH